MRLILSIATAGLVGLAGVSAARGSGGVVLQTDSHTFPVGARHTVQLEFPIGELRVIPSDESRVRFDLRVRCRHRSAEHCAELADRLVLESDDTGGTLSLRLENYPKWQRKGFTVLGELRVPRSLAVRIEMGVGQLEVEGLEGDLDVDLGVGQADIRTPRAQARQVSAEAGIGDASIRGAGGELERSRFLGSRVTWVRGHGRSDVRVHVGVGEATVRLD